MTFRPLLRVSRVRLALSYTLITGALIGVSSFLISRAIIDSNHISIDREIESIAGTLHDALEPLLPDVDQPGMVLQKIFPELCIVGKPCRVSSSLIERHTHGINDLSRYFFRLYDSSGRLVAYSPRQPSRLDSTPIPGTWQTISTENLGRYRQFTLQLHSTHSQNEKNSFAKSWGILQVGRSLDPLDLETKRIQLILVISLPIMLMFVAITSWCLAGMAMQPLLRSYEQQQQFTADMAHELRAPLANLIATVEAMIPLADEQEDLNSLSLIKAVNRQGQRLSQLVTDLLLLSRIEQGRSTDKFEICCINDLVSDLAEEFQEQAGVKDIRIDVNVPSYKVLVKGDEFQLYRLIGNLISNAINYSPSSKSISLEVKIDNNLAVIDVIDMGVGISIEEQELIFQRFYRVDKSRNRQLGGTGLGLAIAEAIARQHRGSIQVSSIPGQGSTFTIHLPLMSTILVA